MMRLDPVEAASPSLLASADRPAYEAKFLAPFAKREAILARLAATLAPDPLAGADGTYQVSTVYLDTPARDVLARKRGFRRTKYRVRRYDHDDGLFLEEKSRRAGNVSKRRVRVVPEELALVTSNAVTDWAGGWFREAVLAKEYAPTARVQYRRTALVGVAQGAGVRLTIDDHVVGEAWDSWSPVGPPSGEELLAGQMILEMKFFDVMPVMFKDLIAAEQLHVKGRSKYRLCGSLADVG